MDDAIAAVRAFNRFYTRFAGALDAHYMDSELSLAEARLLYEIAHRETVLAAELRADLGFDAGYLSRILRRFQAKNWIARGRGEDARRRPISITEAGRAYFAELDARTRAQVAARLEGLSGGERDTLVAALDTVTNLLSAREAPWQLRTFRAGDLALIASRQAILYEPYGWRLPMEILLGEVTTAFLKDFKPGREQCWIAERAGMLAGAIMLVDAGDNVGQLRLLHVEPWARGLGIGNTLVETCVSFARAAGYDIVRLWTHTILAPARRIYEAAGFRIVSSHVHHEFGEPVEGEIWELDLSPGPAPRS